MCLKRAKILQMLNRVISPDAHLFMTHGQYVLYLFVWLLTRRRRKLVSAAIPIYVALASHHPTFPPREGWRTFITYAVGRVQTSLFLPATHIANYHGAVPPEPRIPNVGELASEPSSLPDEHSSNCIVVSGQSPLLSPPGATHQSIISPGPRINHIIGSTNCLARTSMSPTNKCTK